MSGYYKQCCDEHWRTRVSFNSGFLGVYSQQWTGIFFWKFGDTIIQLPHVAHVTFTIRVQFPSSEKHVLWFFAVVSHVSILFQKTQNHHQNFWCNESKVNHCFSGKFNCKYPGFNGGKYFSFCHHAQIPGYIKTCFLAFSEMCIDTLRVHCTIP